MLRRIGGLALLVAITAGCSVQLNTASEPTQVCALALNVGQLLGDPQSGLPLKADSGAVTQVIWPYGYAAPREPVGGISLLDETGKVIAPEGDTVELGGGFGDDA